MTRRYGGITGELVKRSRFTEEVTSSYLWDEETIDNLEMSMLIERVETLVNQSGEFHQDLLSQPRKHNIQIRDLNDDGYYLREPLMVSIEEYPEDSRSVIAKFPELEIFGEGITESEAILDLKYAILDLYDELIEEDLDGLGDLPRAWLRILKQIVGRVDAK